MLNLANAFCERGLKVDLILVKTEGAYLNQVSTKLRIVDLGASRVLTGLFGLIRYLRRERPMAIISAMYHANVVTLIASYLSMSKTPVIACEHNVVTAQFEQHAGLKVTVLKYLMKALYPRAKYIVAVAKSTANDLEKLLGIEPSLIRVIYNPIVNQDLLLKMQRTVPHPWLCSSFAPLILSVGRLTRQKNFSLLLRAFHRVHAHRSARLMILGEGEMRCELEALIQQLDLDECVALCGFVDNPFAYMKQANLFVLSSLYEGLSSVLIEAMACGVPVISTDCGGSDEILEGGKWGKLVPVNNIEALAQAMLETLRTPPPSATERAHHFSEERSADAYLELVMNNR